MADDQYRRLACSGCHVSFPAPTHRGRPPKWCSDACRAPERRERKREYKAKPAKVGQCQCGEQFNPASNGRPYTTCERCRRPPPGANKKEKQCPGCRGIFVSARESQVCCTAKCGVAYRYQQARKTRDPRDCGHCGVTFTPPHQTGARFCSRNCKARDWARRNPPWIPPAFSTYVARYCDTCGKPSGKRSGWTTCTPCIRLAQADRARAANRASSEALHRAAAKEVACDECGARYCPLYGQKDWRGSSRVSLCQVCRPVRKRQHDKVAKAKRSARERGAAVLERVSPRKVFERDGWRCYLCGRDTPKSLRGTTDGRAPELEHVEPLARGGAHSMANTRCACRRCNGIKADHPLAEALRLIGDALRASQAVVGAG